MIGVFKDTCRLSAYVNLAEIVTGFVPLGRLGTP